MEDLPLTCDCGCKETEERNVYKDDINGIFTTVEYDEHCKGLEDIQDIMLMVIGNIRKENIQLEVIVIDFTTSKKLDKWIENHRKQGCVSHTTAGEQFVYEFLPSGIIECQTVKCMCCGEKFTDYVDQKREYLNGRIKIRNESKR